MGLFCLLVKNFTVLSTKVAFFSLINVGNGFHCLRNFSFSYTENYEPAIPIVQFHTCPIYHLSIIKTLETCSTSCCRVAQHVAAPVTRTMKARVAMVA